MEQEHAGESNGQIGPTSGNSKSGTKPMNGRAGGSMGPGLAMKIPGKQPPRAASAPKKSRPIKSNGTGNKEGQSSVTLNLPNGGNNNHTAPKSARDGRRAQKEDKNRLSTSPGSSSTGKVKSRGSSRNNSASPVGRMDSGDALRPEQQRQSTSQNEGGLPLTDVEVTTQNLKQLLQLGNPSRIVYSRIQLLNISENPSSRHRPDCLEESFNASNGRWDPENWHRSLTSPVPTPTPGTAGTEKVRKFSFSESRDRFPDDAPGQGGGGIILGPQRRSFQDGCHVTNSTTSRLSKHHLPSPTERHGRPRLVLRQRSETGGVDYEGSTPPSLRQIESASISRASEEFDWDRRGEGRFRGDRDLSDLRPEPRGRGHRELPRDLHELRSEYARDHRDGDYRDREYRERKFSHSRDFNSSNSWYQSQQRDRRERKYSNHEPEPEWYTAGPTSQFDTIELAGFEEDTPAAASDFSSWGGEIPMEDLDEGGNKKEKKQDDGEELEKGLEGNQKAENEDKGQQLDGAKDQGSELEGNNMDQKELEEKKLADLDFNDLLGIPGFSTVMEQILKENSVSVSPRVDEVSAEPQPQAGHNAQQASSSSSRFSQWFQRDQNLKENGSGGSTPHEELESLAEIAAERGLASPVDVESKQQQPIKADIMKLLTQSKSGNSSPKTDMLSIEQQQELARKLLMQQMKSGAVMSVAELEAKAGARQSPSQTYGGVDVQNTDAFNKLVASIREKDKIRQRQQLLAQQQQQQAALNQFQMKQNLGIPGGRIPSPEELAAHTQNIFQQALIKKQLEKQKDAYREKVRQIEQQRREEQLREAIRSADAKIQESKQMNKSLAFMPTSVMRKMQEGRDSKQSQQDDVMGAEADDLASATASFSAKLAANSGKKVDQPANDLLARIYQSASMNPSKQQSNPGLRRNASFPEVLLEANKHGRSSAFHQPARQGMAANSMDLSKISGSNDQERIRNLLEMQSAALLNKQMPKPTALKQQPNSLAADIYNNNMLKAENQQNFAGAAKPDPAAVDKHEPDMSELKNQHEVALLTQFVLNKFGINEDQLSRLNSQQQQAVVNIVQEQYYHLQVQKQRLLLEKKSPKDPNNPMRIKQGDLPPTSVTKNDMKKPEPQQIDPRTTSQQGSALPKSSTAQVPSSQGVKFPQQPPNTLPGMTHGMPGLIPTTNPQLHPLQLRTLVPPPMQFLPPPMARGPTMIPTILPPQTHMQGRIMPPPPPPNVPLASPLGPPYQAAALMHMQIYQQQQHRALLAAAALQQQQQLQAQAIHAAARQQQQNMRDNRGGADFSNPLEKWFGRDVLSQSHMPAPVLNQSQIQNFGQRPMTLSDIERINPSNQKQE
uniref:uncharacterized protein LOC120348524 n=1 Tax=Styela clava TaxID=7725 RepID=UPI001939ABB4|nr:uncharacterized protein LOC120348524 [Styela clava]